ncbi:hypothetical protein FOQG_19564 [Fusarium oxysporum f. sp. raphani 54005]|uniref:Uncharacterized protein n=1 Tax=Fusarium oxysporum f. sp. raphani 54005 TaxID=1089458 RepID=X0B0R4_FUSOX|nr:hypothetical protein FOQG_19564 [Fusarium oxysporum f. sp. raphani 54005]
MDAEHIHQQPDFGVVANNLRTVSDHIERCGNLPAIEGGRDLLLAVQALTVQVQEFRLEVRDNFDRVHHRIDDIQRRVRVTESNSISRLENSTAVRGDAEIVPLLSVNTGEVIESFPATVDGVSTLTSADVSRILAELGAPIHGSVTTRKRRLLLVMGVTTRAV